MQVVAVGGALGQEGPFGAAIGPVEDEEQELAISFTKFLVKNFPEVNFKDPMNR